LPSPTPDHSFEVEVYLFLGNQARAAGKLDEAKSNYEQVLSIDRNEWRAHYGKGNVLFDEAFLPRTASRVPEPPNAKMNAAIAEYKEAVKLSEAVKEEEKDEVAELYSDLAQAYLHIEDQSSSLAWVNQALKLNPASASAVRRLGNSYFGHDYNEAVKKYKESLRLEPDNALTHQALGAAYNLLEKPDLATREFEEVVRLRPDYLKGYENLGRIYSANKKYNEAIGSFKKALAINPNSNQARYDLILTYILLRDMNSARAQFELLRSQPELDTAIMSNLQNQLKP
jgi:tetratricopeptide (TPR) repeat protein